MSIIVLATSEIISPSYGRINVYIHRKRLRNVGLVLATAFLFVVAVRVGGILLS